VPNSPNLQGNPNLGNIQHQGQNIQGNPMLNRPNFPPGLMQNIPLMQLHTDSHNNQQNIPPPMQQNNMQPNAQNVPPNMQGIPPNFRVPPPGMNMNMFLMNPQALHQMNVMRMQGQMPPGSFPRGFMPGDNSNMGMAHFVPPTYQKRESYIDIEPVFAQLITRLPPPDCLLEKLPSSKTPVIDAFLYCSICNWGVCLSPGNEGPTIFIINDFNVYWDFSQKICSKPSPTETPIARLKALRRWFADFPGIKKIKAVKEGKEPITVKVKPERINDVVTILKKYSQLINTRCRSIAQTGGHQGGNF